MASTGPTTGEMSVASFKTSFRLRPTAAHFVVSLVLAIGGSVTVTGVANADPGLGILGPTMSFPESRYAGAPDGIRCVQRALDVEVDGQYGERVLDAVQQFQAENGLIVDGVVGPVTGDYLLPLTPDPYFCSQYIPTTFYLYDDTGAVSGGGQVRGESGEAVVMGRPTGECVVSGIKGSIKSPFKFVKILWKRRLPTPEEWLATPHPAIFTVNFLYCDLIKE